ncbi:MAG: acyl-CoA/acyl-ACP dehydrogenase [Deltaproteobacteria bacterium]|nr:acyl-CoA/acyl-ACP dehydrogenase [Deltaproteobacteria bacterium]
MEFALNEETVLLKENAGRFLKEKCSTFPVREQLRAEEGFSVDIWREMAGLGWMGFIFDEQYGGLEGDFFDLFILFQEMGKALLPSPFFTSVILSGLLIQESEDSGLKDRFLPPIISGEKIFTLAYLDGQGRYHPGDPGLTAEKNADNGYEISGTSILVPFAHAAHKILAPAATSNGVSIFIIDPEAEGLTLDPLKILSGNKTSALSFDRVKCEAEHMLQPAGKGTELLDRVLPKAMALKSGEMLGGLEQVLDMTVAYMKERVQFGRPLGALQVVHHLCVDMATYLETSRHLACQAAWLMSQGRECRKEIAMAQAWLSDAYKRCASIAQQLHGAIGFTEELDLNLYYKHAKESELAFGDSWFHRQTVAEEMGL